MRKYKPFYRLDREYENRLNEVRVEEGLSFRELAEKMGQEYKAPQYLWALSQGYISPINRHGEIKPWVEYLCAVLHAEPSYIFPREICDISNQLGLVYDQAVDMIHGRKLDEDTYLSEDLKSILKKTLRTLPPRYGKILVLRFYDNLTLEEIAKIFRLSKDRVRQIEARALRLLRHPAMSKKLLEYYKGGDD